MKISASIKSLFILIIMHITFVSNGFSEEIPDSNSISDLNFGKMIGKVVNEEGRPIANAELIIKNTVIKEFTDENGIFIINNIPLGEYTLIISADGAKKSKLGLELNKEVKNLGEVVLSENHIQMPGIEIIDDRNSLFKNVPGSITYINKDEIKKIEPINGNEVIRKVPGVNVVEEEGLGMRANIGIRGLDPDRSRKLLVLEDGIPVALAPYGEPEMYYTPPIDRMKSVEILKGSGQILFGPQTVGGVINYITPEPPEESTLDLQIFGGEGGYTKTNIFYGNTVDNAGFYLNFLNKRADKIGITDFDMTDLTGKVVFNLNKKSNLGFKFSIYNEISNSTYVGLTQPMYEAGNYYVNISPEDELDVKRYSFSLNHEYSFNDNINLITKAYHYTTKRFWKRQDFSLNSKDNNKPSNWTGVTWGDTTVAGGAIFMKNSTGNRNREFNVTGVESKLSANYSIGEIKNCVITGARYLYEKADEQRINGNKYNVNSGSLAADEQRIGHALSFYLQNKTYIFDHLSLSYGIRYESFNYKRDISRKAFKIDDEKVIRDTSLIAENTIGSLIPGIGFNYIPMETITIFGGVHRGFAPPRTKDAISNSGEVYNLEAELSWNYELGMRTNFANGVDLEITAFALDFSNMVIPVSESSGGIGAGFINGGETMHKGIEGNIRFNAAKILDLTYRNIYLDISATYVNSEFTKDRFVNGVNIKGNRTPYSPEFYFSSGLTFEIIKDLTVSFTGNYIGEQNTDLENSENPSPNGRTGLIPEFFTIDAVSRYHISSWNSNITLSAKNITDNRYISSRRPQGIKMGLPLYVSGGIEVSL